MISDDKNNETIKVTKVLQFLSNTEPKDAKLGAIVRFMWNPGNGTTLYWLQGEIDKRVDKYDGSKELKWQTNRVRVKNLQVIDFWGEDRPQTLPETVVVNLKSNTTLVIRHRGCVRHIRRKRSTKGRAERHPY